MPQLVCPTVVGRDTELTQLEEALAKAREGAGRLVILSGEAGIGKTRLASELADRARAIGAMTLVGRSIQASTPTPYRPLVEAMQASLRESGAVDDPGLDPYRAALRRLLPEVGADGAAESAASPLVVMEGVLRLLTQMAEDGGLLLVLEDLHWADADTLGVVEYLADHLDSVPALCLCTERTETSTPARELIAQLAARRAAERLELTALEDEEVEEMTRLTLGAGEIPGVLTTALRARASGVPFLVEEMLSAYLAAGGPEERRSEWWISRRIAEALPPSYRDVVRERLALLDEDARSVVNTAAMLGRSFDWRLLTAAAGLDEHSVLGGLRAAAGAGLLATTGDHFAAFEFRHALAREAVLADLLPPERSSLALRAADAIEATYPGMPGEWCQRVADLREEGGDRLRAMGALQEVARRALTRSAFATAEQALGRARDLAGDDHMGWIAVDDLLLDVYSRSGKTERVVEIGNRILETLAGQYRGSVHESRPAGVHLRIARGVAPAGDWSLVERHLDHARRLGREADDNELLTRVDSLAAQASLGTGHLLRAKELAAAADRSARRLELWDALCEALDTQGRIALREDDLDRAVAAFTGCIEVAETRALPLWQVRSLLELGRIDRLTRMEFARLETARVLAAEIGAVSILASIDLELGWGHLGSGDLEAALAAIDRCLEACRVHRLAILPTALSARCMLHALRDDSEALEAAAAEAVGEAAARAGEAAEPAGEVAVEINGRTVLALVHGDEPAALEHLDRAARLSTAVELGADPLRSFAWLWGARALLHAAAGREDAIAEADAAGWHPRVAAYLGYARAISHGRAGRKDEALAEHAAASKTMTPDWPGAHAELVVARCAFADGWGEPERWIREALTFLDSASLPRFSAACKAVLRRAGAPVPRRGRGEAEVPPELQQLGVTSREMDVLLLVGERLSNKEIGARLYLSPRTIEGHVASLLRKLDLAARADLVESGRVHASAAPTAHSGLP